MIPTVQEKVGNVKVVCRFRPINERERQQGGYQINDILDDKTVSIKEAKHDKNNAEPLQFSFDKVFNSDTTQQQVFKYAAAPVIDSVIEGFNGTIFAYGQTASGKTHTMQGQIGKQIQKQSGIIPRMVRRLFTAIQQSSQHVEFRIKISLVELYMEKLRDLLDQAKPDLKIRSDKKKGIFIQDLTETYISSPEEVYQLMQIARKTRVIASTNMNERSSRSHMLFILSVSQNNTDDLSAKTGKLYLVDLAGSEKVGKTGAQGKLLDEAKKINASLTALGKVINSLTDGKSTHVPYRDSKLTRVLQESLGGNSKTSLIVTCSPHSNNVPQTISTLRFGISAKKIKNKPKINKELTVPQLQNLLEKAEKEIVQKNSYIEQIKNYVLVDLKQKSIPIFSHEKTSVLRNQQTQLATQLERQLQMERSMHLVQEEQLAALKKRFQELIAQKQIVEKENEDLRMNESREPIIIKKQVSIDGDISEQHDSVSELPQEYAQLLGRYQNQKEKRLKAQEKNSTQEKRMCKKLIQLQNNLSQLTHAYYDLLIIQQRYKVDNIFLRKRIQEKDLTIISLKKKIKDLEDQNRELQDQRWNDQENKEQVPQSKYGISSEQEEKFEKLLERNAPNIPGTKVVKVLRGGNR